jgi:hypothetical protein
MGRVSAMGVAEAGAEQSAPRARAHARMVERIIGCLSEMRRGTYRDDEGSFRRDR